MKAVQIMFDEDLLAELDQTPMFALGGGPQFLRRLTSEFLRQHHEREIDAQYERAYAGIKDPLGADFEGWEDEGIWLPNEPGGDLALHLRFT